MKQAKATKNDMQSVEAIWDALERMNEAVQPMVKGDVEDEPFDEDDGEQCVKAVADLLWLYRESGSAFFRVLGTLDAVMLPKNECLDLTSDVVEHHPKRRALEAQVAALTERAERAEGQRDDAANRAMQAVESLNANVMARRNAHPRGCCDWSCDLCAPLLELDEKGNG